MTIRPPVERPALILIAVLAAALLPGATRAGAQMADVTDLGFDRGAASARIAIVEFGDFGCSACAQFETETFAQLNREFIMPGRVKFKYVPFVMGSFPNSTEATKAALCAADQSSYWSMHDVLFGKQREWLRLRDPAGKFEEFAAALRLDVAAFRECYAGNDTNARIEAANRTARSLRVRGTPTFYINGSEALGAIPIETWRRILTGDGSRLSAGPVAKVLR